jgi:hypothetical protein
VVLVSRPMPSPIVRGVVLTGGTSTTGRLVGSVASKYACSLLWGGNGESLVRLRVGLARCWVLREQPVGVLPWSGPSGPVEPLVAGALFGGWWWSVGVGMPGGDRWLLENCTVDASIFE